MRSKETCLNIVLVEPEIPQNTGCIGRLCLATNSTLHLVEPLGFDISDSSLRRAGLDYWEHLDVFTYPNIEDLFKKIPSGNQKVFFSKKAGQIIFDYKFNHGAWLFFGRETFGLPDYLIEKNAWCSVRIPIFDARVRSLNLSQAVGIATYEALRQFSGR